ncbi:MAG: hypothetical protein RL263_1524 [Bacteroidota bacterium]
MNSFSKVIASFLLLAGSNSYVSAQAEVTGSVDFNNYQPIYCSGEVPYNLKKLSSAKAQEEVRRIRSSKSSGRDRKRELEFAIQSNFLEDQILTSGQILYGDPMTNYLEKVGLKVLASKPELQSQVQFFVLRSHVPNAYVTHHGLVFVSLGLLARLDNEAQLAVILAHELQHYILKHSLIAYKEAKYVSGYSRGSDLDERIKAFYKFNVGQEEEADKMGFEMLRETEYDFSEGINVFENLKYQDHPFLEAQWSIDSFETRFYRFPENLKSSVTSLLEEAEKKDRKRIEQELNDAYSSHPNLDKRIMALQGDVKSLNLSGKKKFLFSKEEFEMVRKISRYELLLLYVRRGDHGRSLYLTRVFELLYGSSPFISRVKAMNAYALAEHRWKLKDLNAYGCSVLDNRGGWRPLSAALLKLDAKEMNSFALKVVLEEKNRYPSDLFIDQLGAKLLNITQAIGVINLDEYLKFSLDSSVKSEAQPTKNGGLVKPGQISSNPGVKPYHYGSIYHLLKLKNIANFLEVNRITSGTQGVAPRKGFRERMAELDQVNRKRYQKNLNETQKIFVLQPNFSYFTSSFGGVNKRNYFGEETKKIELLKAWNWVIKNSQVSAEIVENIAREGYKTEQLFKYSQLNDWLTERLNNDTQEMILFYSQFVDEFAETQNEPLICWEGYEYKSTKRPFLVNDFLYAIMFPIYTPIYLYSQFKVDYYTEETTVVYNMRTSRAVMNRVKRKNYRMMDDYNKAQIYETLYEISHLPSNR